MKALRVTKRASGHLDSIADYTIAMWGLEQSTIYLRMIQRIFQKLRQDPFLGTAWGEVKRGYRAFPAGQHVIFYRIRRDTVEISGVLHNRMNPHRHF